jgi:hypothetical protein
MVWGRVMVMVLWDHDAERQPKSDDDSKRESRLGICHINHGFNSDPFFFLLLKPLFL